MIVGVHTTRDAQAHEVVASEAILAGDRVTVSQNVADLTGANASFEIELASQGLSRELFLRNVGQHLVGINEDGVATGRTLIRNAVLIELGSQVMHLLDTGFNHLKLNVFLQTDSQSVHVTAVHTTVGEEAFKRNAEQFGTFVPFFLVSSNKAAHVDESVFLG